MRVLSEADIDDLALGAAVLGSGGGGDAYLSKLVAHRALAAHGAVQLLDVDQLDDDALVVSLGLIGAPIVAIERPLAEDTFFNVFNMLERHLGQPITAVMTLEIGGGNALAPLPLAARLHLPMLDADAMGRALPELHMTSFHAHRLSAAPFALADDRGNRTVIEIADNHWAEKLARSIVLDMGGSAASAIYPLRGKQIKAAAITGSVSRAIQIGRVFRAARQVGQPPFEAIRQALLGTTLFKGKVVDVQRQSHIGFARGQAIIEGTGSYQPHKLTVQSQNEYLVAKIGTKVLATVPDVISIFDLRTGEPIAVEALRYGFQVAVLSIPAPAVWRTLGGLALVGPQAFGYPFEYVAMEPHMDTHW